MARWYEGMYIVSVANYPCRSRRLAPLFSMLFSAYFLGRITAVPWIRYTRRGPRARGPVRDRRGRRPAGAPH